MYCIKSIILFLSLILKLIHDKYHMPNFNAIKRRLLLLSNNISDLSVKYGIECLTPLKWSYKLTLAVSGINPVP